MEIRYIKLEYFFIYDLYIILLLVFFHATLFELIQNWLCTRVIDQF